MKVCSNKLEVVLKQLSHRLFVELFKFSRLFGTLRGVKSQKAGFLNGQ